MVLCFVAVVVLCDDWAEEEGVGEDLAGGLSCGVLRMIVIRRGIIAVFWRRSGGAAVATEDRRCE